jgi:hypothetical protein
MVELHGTSQGHVLQPHLVRSRTLNVLGLSWAAHM